MDLYELCIDYNNRIMFGLRLHDCFFSIFFSLSAFLTVQIMDMAKNFKSNLVPVELNISLPFPQGLAPVLNIIIIIMKMKSKQRIVDVVYR